MTEQKLHLHAPFKPLANSQGAEAYYGEPAIPIQTAPAGTTPLLEAVNGFLETLSTLWRRKNIIAGICAAAIGLALMPKVLLGPQYAATALVQLDLGSQDAPGHTPPTTAIDGGTLVETQTSLIESRAMARQVVERLGLDESESQSQIRTLIRNLIGHFNSAAGQSRVDVATERLMSNLKITSKPRSYLITVTHTAPTPQQAARVANAVVSEYMHYRAVQTLADRVAFAQRALTDLVGTYGVKHPMVMRAEANLALERSRIAAEEEKADLMSDRELAETGKVVPAQAITIPIGAKTSTILLLAFLGGLVGGTALVLAIERSALVGALMQRVGHWLMGLPGP